MEILNSFKFIGNIDVAVICTTAFLSYYIIGFLKAKYGRFPLRQLVPFVSACLLLVLRTLAMNTPMGWIIIWDAMVNGLIATGSYAKVVSFLKDRGMLNNGGS